MIHSIWTAVLYRPLINALAFLIYIIPGGDVGLAIIALTILVKLILFPLSQKAIESQAEMNILTPELNKIKNSGASKEEQAKQTFELYKKHKVNPFSGCLLQIPILIVVIALYSAFFKGINLGGGILYSFVPAPAHMNMIFLGILDISQKSLFLAVLAGISQFLQARSMPQMPTGGGASFQDSFSKSMNMQMKYVFPLLITFIAWNISGAVALYWITSNLFMVAQQMYVQREKNFKMVIK